MPSGVLSVKPVVASVSTWRPRATSTAATPARASTPPTVPPIAPAPMMTYLRPFTPGSSVSSNAIGREYVCDLYEVVVVLGVSVGADGNRRHRVTGFVEAAQGVGVANGLERRGVFLVFL